MKHRLEPFKSHNNITIEMLIRYQSTKYINLSRRPSQVYVIHWIHHIPKHRNRYTHTHTLVGYYVDSIAVAVPFSIRGGQFHANSIPRLRLILCSKWTIKDREMQRYDKVMHIKYSRNRNCGLTLDFYLSGNRFKSCVSLPSKVYILLFL